MIVKLTEEQIREYFDSIDKELLERQYVDYSFIINPTTYDNPLTYEMAYPINEGLVRTYPIEKTIEYVKNYFKLDDKQIMKIKGYNSDDRIMILIPLINDNLEMVKKAMRLCGYYLAYPKKEGLVNGKWAKLQFEPKFEKDISSELRQKMKKLYHLTPKYNIGKIRNIGFSPRSKNKLFEYPGRIYFFKGNVDKKEVIAMGNALSVNNDKVYNNGEYALLTISLDKVPNDVEFCFDPNYPNGVYTRDNISPNVITDIEYFKFKTYKDVSNNV